MRICAVAGVIAAGANCDHTGHSEPSQMDVKQLIEFLESGAVIMSSADRMKEKSAAEEACYLLKDRCTFEMKKTISRMVPTKK